MDGLGFMLGGRTDTASGQLDCHQLMMTTPFDTSSDWPDGSANVQVLTFPLHLCLLSASRGKRSRSIFYRDKYVLLHKKDNYSSKPTTNGKRRLSIQLFGFCTYVTWLCLLNKRIFVRSVLFNRKRMLFEWRATSRISNVYLYSCKPYEEG